MPDAEGNCIFRVNRPAVILLLVLAVIVLPARPAWSCGPVHEWKPLREAQQPVFGPRAGDDVAAGLMSSLRGVLPPRDRPLGLVIVKVLDSRGTAADPRAVETLEAALKKAAAADPGFSCIPSRSLLEYLRQEGLRPERLINPTVSARAADALSFDALIWFRIMDYGVTDSRCLDVLEDENTVIADIRTEKAVVRSKVVDARIASILWIDEQAAEYIYQNVFLVHGVLPVPGLTTEVFETTAMNYAIQSENIALDMQTGTEQAPACSNNPATVPAAPIRPENMVVLPPEIPLEAFITATTTALSAFPGLTVEIVEGSESYQLSPQKNTYWQPHDETTH